jgi:hypothetical protein
VDVEKGTNPTMVYFLGRSKSSQASFVYIGLIPIGIDKCNTKIMIDTVGDPDLFRVEN